MTLGADEFMRRFLLHVLPGGFHRIRHCGLLANGCHEASTALARTLLGQPSPTQLEPEVVGATNTNANANANANADADDKPRFVCRHCGAAMIVVQIFARATPIRVPPEQAPMP